LLGALCCTVAIGAVMPLGAAGASTAVAAAPAVAAQQSCNDYIPRGLALNVPSAAPGQTITITGIAEPGDVVTIRIATLGGPEIVLGTATANAAGLFSAQITIPANFVEGTYNISVSSPLCAGVGTITLVVTFPRGRCLDRAAITAQRGDSVEWELLGDLDTTKPLTVVIVPVGGGASVVAYTGPYPASGSISFTVPASLANGRYRIVESGTSRTGSPVSARCGRLRVRGGGGGGTTTTTTTTTVPGSTTTTTTIPGATTTTTIPPATCSTGSQVFNFDGDRLIAEDGFNTVVEYTSVVPVNLAAGTWSIADVVSEDGYAARINVVQTSEVWELQFLDGSGNVVATSGPTGDLADRVAFASWNGSLGTVSLPTTVTGVRAHHLPALFADGSANSVVPVRFTLCSGPGGGGGSTTTTPGGTTTTTPGGTTTTTPGGTTTTTPGGTTTTTPGGTTTTIGGGGGGSTTTIAGAVATTTTPGATTTTPVGSGDLNSGTGVLGAAAERQVTQIGSSGTGTQVKGASASRQSGSGLAVTGSTVRPFIVLGAALIAAGALFALGARRRSA